MSSRPPVPNPLLSLQDVLDAAFARELIREGRNPAMVLKEQSESRAPQADAAVRAIFEFRSGPVHRSQRMGGPRR